LAAAPHTPLASSPHEMKSMLAMASPGELQKSESCHGTGVYSPVSPAHVAQKATRWLRIDAKQFLLDAKAKLHVRPMQFHWHAAQDCDVGALLLRMQQIL
jgi:hypothetical protein